MKLDPYINVDPGTMSPFQHGEVYVTDDGTETDLDLGHYERFVRTRTSRTSNFTTGKIYSHVIAQGAARRLSRRDGAGDPAHHRRDQAPVPGRGRRRRRASSRSAARSATSNRYRSSRRSGRWASRSAATRTLFIHLTLVPFISIAARDQDEADAALGEGTALDRSPARRAGLPVAAILAARAAREDRAVHERRGARRRSRRSTSTTSTRCRCC